MISLVLRKIFGPKRKEETWEWRILHNEELYDFCSSPNIIRVIKSRRIKRGWASTIDLGAYGVLVWKPEER
jgi:predicted transcriptional regulator of viral defense system